jgi:hypothetical protein
MEREIIFTGVGGQGIQLMAKVLAQAAVEAGLRRRDARQPERVHSRHRRRRDRGAPDRAALVEILTMCPTDWFVAPDQGPAFLERNWKPTYPLGVIRAR